MRVTVTHPVPLRWTPPRARRERLAFRRETTSVEIPEAPGLARSEGVETGPVFAESLTYAVHEGGFWLPVRANHLDRTARFGGDPLPLARVLGSLASAPEKVEPGGLFRAGTPLCGLAAYAGPRLYSTGEDLPGSTLGRVHVDHGAAARAALARHAARNLAIDGDALFMRVCPPVLLPCRSPAGDVELPWFPGRGPAFPPHRADEARRLAAILGSRDGETRLSRAVHQMPAALDPAAYGEIDLDDYVSAAPAILEDVAERVGKRLVLVGRDFPDPARVALDRLRPLGDLGRIGAIPPDLRADVVALTLAAATALREACPHGYRPDDLDVVETYLERFARPRLAAAAESLAEADLDGIGRLAR